MDIKRGVGAVTESVALVAILAALLTMGTTGACLWRYNAVDSPGRLTSLLDAIGSSGSVLITHLLLGCLLALCAIWYLVFTTVAARPSNLTSHGHRFPPIQIGAQTALLMVGSLVVLSGISMYAGWYHGASTHSILVELHRFGGYGLIGLACVIVPFRVIRAFTRSKRLQGRFPIWAAGMTALVVTAAVALTLSRGVTRNLESVAGAQAATIDGIATQQEWQRIPAVLIPCAGGANFAGGVSGIRIKSFYDKQFIYFLFQWSDSTRSLNRRLLKKSSGWSVLTSDTISVLGEAKYYEDQLAVSISRSRTGCNATCHGGTMDDPGAHFTAGDTVDLWHWRAQATDPTGQADDGWWGGWNAGAKDGRNFDNSPAGGYFSNLNKDWGQPYFLPQPPQLYPWIDLRTNAMTPYFAEADTFRIGVTIPGLLVSPFMGDRGNVRARGAWRNGIWTVEMARARLTGSPADIPIDRPVYLNIAVFDNADLSHSSSIRPLRLILK